MMRIKRGSRECERLQSESESRLKELETKIALSEETVKKYYDPLIENLFKWDDYIKRAIQSGNSSTYKFAQRQGNSLMGDINNMINSVFKV